MVHGNGPNFATLVRHSWPFHRGSTVYTKFQAITPMHSQENARKPQIWSVSRSQSGTKMRKINRPLPKSNQFWKWASHISMPNFKVLLPYMHSQDITWKPIINPVSQSQSDENKQILTKNLSVLKVVISLPNFRPLLWWVIKKMPGNLTFDQCHYVTVMPKCSHHEIHSSADHGLQNTRWTGKPPLYNHVYNQENQVKFRLGPAKVQKFLRWLKWGKINKPWLKSNQFWRWSG